MIWNDEMLSTYVRMMQEAKAKAKTKDRRKHPEDSFPGCSFATMSFDHETNARHPVLGLPAATSSFCFLLAPSPPPSLSERKTSCQTHRHLIFEKTH
jgi:hypothetical protein